MDLFVRIQQDEVDRARRERLDEELKDFSKIFGTGKAGQATKKKKAKPAKKASAKKPAAKAKKKKTEETQPAKKSAKKNPAKKKVEEEE